MPNQWYIYRDKRRQGPFSDAELLQLAARGALQPSSFVWKEGLDTWVRAQRIRGLFQPQPTPGAPTVLPYEDATGLAAGLPLGRVLTVIEVSPSRLVLGARNRAFLLLAAAGIALIAATAITFVPELTPAPARALLPPLVKLAALLAGVMLTLIGLAKLGVTYAFGNDGTVARRQLVTIRWPKGTFSAVYLGVVPGAVTSDVLQLWLWRSAGDHHLQLTWGLGQDPATMRLIAAATVLAKLLDLPIDVDGRAANSTPELKEALAGLDRP